MNITITLTADSKLVTLLTAFMTALTGNQVQQTADTTVDVKQNGTPVAKEAKTVKSKAIQPDHDAVAVTIEQVRAAVQAKAKDGKRELVKALLTEFEVENVTSLPQEKYSDFLTAVKAL